MITHIVGVTYKNKKYNVNRQDIIKNLCGQEKIFLRREYKNRFDKNAVAVMLGGDNPQRIGYVKAELAGFLAEYWNDWKFFAKIKEIRDGDPKANKPYGMSITVTKSKRRDNRKIYKEKKKRE